MIFLSHQWQISTQLRAGDNEYQTQNEITYDTLNNIFILLGQKYREN